MSYSINSIFGPTIQGEGALQGTPCIFLRFSKCNLWTGHEKDRASAVCQICDTDFANGVQMSADEIIRTFRTYKDEAEWIVISGGEPLLQLDDELIGRLQNMGWKINLETNGTLPLPLMKYNYNNQLHTYFGKSKLDHISFSPKTKRNSIKLKECDSLKILWPTYDYLIEEYSDFPADHKFLQPTDEGEGFNKKILDRLYGLQGWKLSPQLHKLIGVL